MSQAHFLQGAAQTLAQKAQLKPLPHLFIEGGRTWMLHWRDARVAIYSRDEAAGTTHSFHAFAVGVVKGIEERDECIGRSQSLDDLIDVVARWEREHER